MSKIYEVRSVARSDGRPHGWGARHNRREAEDLLAERSQGARREWAEQYHERWWIEEIDTTGLFEIPPAPTPRQQYSTRVVEVVTGQNTWNTLKVDVLDSASRVVASYERNYSSLLRTFEPFRQGDRMFALISRDYTATAVLDLHTGEVVAEEEPQAGGFCPAGFYVPDWWDLNDGSKLPGSMYWDADDELPQGGFGFVWGCVWGDDSSSKVQHLDLTRVQEGKIIRDERFGYVELADSPKLDAKEFIQCAFSRGQCQVTFSTLARFDLQSGKRQPHEFEEPASDRT